MDKNATKIPQYWQSECLLAPQTRGFHLISTEIKQVLLSMPPIHTGLVHLFLQHTSASLAISENTCTDVPLDLYPSPLKVLEKLLAMS